MDPGYPAAKRQRLDDFWPNSTQENPTEPHLTTSVNLEQCMSQRPYAISPHPFLGPIWSESGASSVAPSFNKQESPCRTSATLAGFEIHGQPLVRDLTYTNQPAAIWGHSTPISEIMQAPSWALNTSYLPLSALPPYIDSSAYVKPPVHIPTSSQPYLPYLGQVSEQHRQSSSVGTLRPYHSGTTAEGVSSDEFSLSTFVQPQAKESEIICFGLVGISTDRICFS